MEQRREALLAAFNHPKLSYKLISSGAYFAYVKHPFDKESAKSVAMRLAGEHDVLCLPGSMFGPDQESYLRFAFANSPAEDMAVLVERLIESQAAKMIEGLSHITFIVRDLDRMEKILDKRP